MAVPSREVGARYCAPVLTNQEVFLPGGVEERSTDKIPANAAKSTSATSRLPQHRLKNRKMHEMHKIKLINILNRLTTRRQDTKIDALINYITSDITDDDITDPDITGEIKSPDIDNGEKKSPIIKNVENKSPTIDYKACVQSDTAADAVHADTEATSP